MPSRSFLPRPAVLLVLSLCAVAAVVSILGRLAGGPDSVKKAVTLVSPGGAEAYPSFSPDGKRLVYGVRLAKDQRFHLFVRNLPDGGRWKLTGAAGSDIAPAWSPDGASVAFLRMENGRAAGLVVAAAGGVHGRAGGGRRRTEGGGLRRGRGDGTASPGGCLAAGQSVAGGGGGRRKPVACNRAGSCRGWRSENSDQPRAGHAGRFHADRFSRA